MKKYIQLLLLFVFTQHSFAQQWELYKNLEFSFRVDFNGDIKTLTKAVPVDGQTFDMNMFYIENTINDESASNLVYAVAHTAYNEEDYSDNDPERDESVLSSAIDGAAKNVNGRIISSHSITLNGFPGKDAKFEIQGAYIHVRIFLIKHELYFVQVITISANDENKDINRFLKSFDIIKTKE